MAAEISRLSEKKLVEQLLAVRLERDRRRLDLSDLSLERDDGLRLQLLVLDRLASSGDPVGGWKIAFTSGKALDRMGEGYRPFAFIPRSRVLPTGTGVIDPPEQPFQIEVEICVELEQDLSGAVDRNRARDAVRSLRVAFELVERRTAPSADEATALADGCANWGIVVGSGTVEVPEQVGVPRASLWRDGQLVAATTPGYVYDDPFLSLARVSQLIERFGGRLEAGAFVITGALVVADVAVPGHWRGEVAGIGDVDLVVEARYR